MIRVLMVISEAAPFSKTGGLADVGKALPESIAALGADMRVITPMYQPDAALLARAERVARLAIPDVDGPVELWRAATSVPVYLVRYPPYFERAGTPYQSADGRDWPDNDRRFALLCRVAQELAQGRIPTVPWRADVVHANDWQTGLLPYLLHLEGEAGGRRPGVLFTVHNLAYQGLFDRDALDRLHLPPRDFHPNGTEFYGFFSFMKAGLVYADHLSTVSPGYAREIQTPELGMGLDGLLRNRSGALTGILNGIDEDTWNPEHDPDLPAPYGRGHLEGKALCKSALQAELDLFPEQSTLLLGMISRVVEQKGADIVLQAIPTLLQGGRQLAILGNGDQALERDFRAIAARHPGRVAVRIGFDEALAHRIEAGVDAFLMPSRFEPCGLNQMYSLRYGTLPIVHRTGGLADTVVDAEDTHGPRLPNGFAFTGATVDHLLATVERAEAAYRQPALWRYLQENAMGEDFGWRRAARDYLDIYRAIAR